MAKRKRKIPLHPHRSFFNPKFTFQKYCARSIRKERRKKCNSLDTIASSPTTIYQNTTRRGMDVRWTYREGTTIDRIVNNRDQRNRAGNWRGILMEDWRGGEGWTPRDRSIF